MALWWEDSVDADEDEDMMDGDGIAGTPQSRKEGV